MRIEYMDHPEHQMDMLTGERDAALRELSRVEKELEMVKRELEASRAVERELRGMVREDAR